MSERKVLNKYYPPDFDPSKIPRMKLPRNRQYTVRLMAPFNMRCVTCGEYIYKGKKFNARKEDVENEDYLGIRIYRFYIKCTRCLQEISFKTDPQNTDYVIEAGATRNFMALKLAEEQAQREEDERKEEEANNPMKLLEIRTEQSRQEIALLESLEELKELNRRQASVDYESMLVQYHDETPAERAAREQREDDELIKSMKFPTPGQRVVAEEIIEELEEDTRPDAKAPPLNHAPATQANKSDVRKNESWNRSIGAMTKRPLGNLVKVNSKKSSECGERSPMTDQKSSKSDSNEGPSNRICQKSGDVKSTIPSETKLGTEVKEIPAAPSALSLLAGYSDDDYSDE